MDACVSVIVPVYNDQKGIDACLAALARQTYPQVSLEVIMVDNGSDPPIVLDPDFKDIARIVKCEKPGSYAARNAGIAVARGSILAFTDADCVPAQDWLEAGVDALASFTGRCIVGGQVELTLSKHPTPVEQYQYISTFMQKENILEREFSATANMFFEVSLIKELGPFSEHLLSGGDRDWCWRASASGIPVTFCESAVVHTKPRRSLEAAIRQTRRVAGGRYQMRQTLYASQRTGGLQSVRQPYSATQWILAHPALSAWDKVKVFAVAAILRAAQSAESIRLRLGGSAERR